MTAENASIASRHDGEKNKFTKLLIRKDARMEINRKTTRDFQNEIESLRAVVSNRDTRLKRLTRTLADNTSGIRDLLDQIYALDIDRNIKRNMTDLCLTILETKINEKRMQIDLTKSDAAFLSALRKKHPNLHHRELRISLLIMLDYDTIEIAHALSMSKRGLENIRYKLHKKLGLRKNQPIKSYLKELAGTM
ncbi:MAG: hypothetical protein WCH05_08690 [Chlorobiaceae bacterium]